MRRMTSSCFIRTRPTSWRSLANTSWRVVALALAVETAVLTYLLVEFGEDNGGELEIPDSVNMSELIEAANEIDILNAPIDIPSLVGGDEETEPAKHAAKNVVDKIRRFRNLIHSAALSRNRTIPGTFTHEQLEEFKDMYESVVHSLLLHLRRTASGGWTGLPRFRRLFVIRSSLARITI